MNVPKGKQRPKNLFRNPVRLPKAKKNTLDMNCLESTPVIMRIEIDRIFKQFIDNPEANEYIFAPDLNNLQRKYIHFVAQKMNIISKSYGKEPDRRLHIKKRGEQLSNQAFVITPSELAQQHLHAFVDKAMPNPDDNHHSGNAYNMRKLPGKLIHSPASTPSATNVPNDIINMRKNLPVYDSKQKIIEMIQNNQIVVISSETGSGKTTQIPQFIVENATKLGQPCKVICTQPRRISTVAAAERVSYERADSLGASVGYHIKLEQKYGYNTNIIFCTTGVFLRNLMGSIDGFRNITHIIIDEIHERDKLSDFLLICIKQNLSLYPDLKIILMSATINVNKFIEYFGKVEVLTIPGRLFPIETLFLEEILVLTEYMSPKMRQAEQNDKQKRIIHTDVFTTEAPIENIEVNPCVDEALDEYLNFSDNYNYKLHYEEATAQLGMYFLSEGVPVDYQHSKTGQSALMIAAYLADKEFISRLCNMGARLDLSCKFHKTVFDYALDNPEVLRLLEYVKDKRSAETEKSSVNKSGEYLLELYDKTTPDDVIDYDLIVKIISFVHTSKVEGAVLVFLPGYDEIMLCNDRIVNSTLESKSYRIFFLHSSMNIKDQNEVFRPSNKCRKIILSTNIAETSITIDDVVFVIDVGKAKEKCFDAYNKVSSLQTRWISQACANQRQGRAGRTRPGMCFRLYSTQRFNNTEPERVPEILRVSLEELCLHAKVLAPEDMNIHNFLSLAPDAPSANSIKVAIENLQFLGALDKEEDLTRLGAYLSQLTIEPQLGKMLIYGVIFRCLEPILTLVAALSHKDPFQLPPQANLRSAATEKRKGLIEGVMSDHLVYLQVFKKWQESSSAGHVSKFCQEFFISHSAMNSILETRSQLLGQLRAVRFVHQSNNMDEYNKYANCWPLVKAIICTGVYPNLAYPFLYNLATRREKKVNIQSSSVCANHLITTWLAYDEMIKHRNGLYIRGVTAVTIMTVGLVCGIDTVTPSPNVLNIDDWIEFEYPDHSVIYLRNAMEFLINKVMLTPWYSYNPYDQAVVDTLTNVLEAEEANALLKVPTNVGEKPRFFLPQKYINHRSQNNQIRRNNDYQRNGRTHNGYHATTSQSTSYNRSSYNENVSEYNSGLRSNQYRSDRRPNTGAIRRTQAQRYSDNNNRWYD